MLQNCPNWRSSNAKKVLLALLAVGLPAGSAAMAQDGSRRPYDDSNARVRAVQYSLERDRSDLEAARRKVDAIIGAREKQLNDLSAMRLGGDGQVDKAKVDLDKATQAQSRLRDQLQTIKKDMETAKAKLDPIHAAELAKFESTDSFKASFAIFDKARQELKVPTDAALDQIAQTREFQDLVAAARAAKVNADKLREDRTANPKAVAAADDAFVAVDNKVQDLEEKALTADPKIVDLRKRVDEAQAVLRKMRDQMEQELLKDPAYTATVDELHQRQTAFDSTTDDLKKLDVQVVDLRGTVDKKSDVPQDNRTALRDAEAELDTINSDLAQARQDAAKFESRVQDDQESLNYAQRDRDSAGQEYSAAPPRSGDVTVYAAEPPIYVPAERVTVYSSYYSPPVYYGPSYYSEPGISIGFGYYPSYYYSHCSSDHYYYNRYYYNSNHHYNEGHRDWQNGNRDHSYSNDRTSDDRHVRNDGSRNQRDARESRPPVDHQTYQDSGGARTARNVHTPQTNTDEPRRATRSPSTPRESAARPPEDVHGRRVTESAPARSEARPSPEPTRAPRSAHVDSPAVQEAPRRQESPRHQEAAPQRREAPRHQDSARSDRTSQKDSSDSTSRSHMKSR